MINKTLTRLL